ncbi:MAG: dihydroorotase [Betaproteobacteria bacterium]|nr:dihydroorotase [Betaproteobacteria bacterium]
MDRISITRPDDWHLHLRDGQAMASVLADTARRFGRAIIMPNLKPPVCTTQQALHYRERILGELPEGASFDPLMTLYLTDDTPPEEIVRAKLSGQVHGVKYYPAGATTHSDAGVTRISRCFLTLEKMEQLGLPLLIHGEVTDPLVDVFDREKAFVDEVLGPIVERFSSLKVVLEHITTRDAVQYVEVTGPNLAATITPQHLLLNRNALFLGGIRPHHYCLPVLKREEHREALVAAAISGNPKFFLGTDSAPHSRATKETACGCAGVYSAHAAIELYATAFEEAGALDKLEGFASHFGADFYGLPRNQDTLTLLRQEWRVPQILRFGGEELVPLRAGETIPWKLA